jgi:hypothetical protein
MEELEVTKYWMAGVVGMMLVFGIIAIVGWLKHGKDEADD